MQSEICVLMHYLFVVTTITRFMINLSINRKLATLTLHTNIHFDFHTLLDMVEAWIVTVNMLQLQLIQSGRLPSVIMNHFSEDISNSGRVYV